MNRDLRTGDRVTVLTSCSNKKIAGRTGTVGIVSMMTVEVKIKGSTYSVLRRDLMKG